MMKIVFMVFWGFANTFRDRTVPANHFVPRTKNVHATAAGPLYVYSQGFQIAPENDPKESCVKVHVMFGRYGCSTVYMYIYCNKHPDKRVRPETRRRLRRRNEGREGGRVEKP